MRRPFLFEPLERRLLLDGESLGGGLPPDALDNGPSIQDVISETSLDTVSVHKTFDPGTEVARVSVNEIEVDPILVEVAKVDVELRVVRGPTPVGPDGRRNRPPANAEWIDEWDSFWAELWVRSHDGRGVSGGTVGLAYNPEFFTAVEIDHGPVFVSETSGELDDANGIVTAVGGHTERRDAGGGSWVLLGRVRFESLDGDQVPAGESWRPGDLGLNLTAAEFEAVNAETVEVTLGGPPDTELWPVSFDVNDDGHVDFGDLEHVARVFLQDVVQSDSPLVGTCDFDRSGRVDHGDFAFFAANFLRHRQSSREILFHADFRQRWAGTRIDVEDDSTIPADALDNVFEALFRHQFSNNASGAQQGANAYFLSIENQNPSLEFLKRFDGHTPSVRNGSDFVVGAGLKFRIDSWKWISNTEIQLAGGYYEGNMSSSGNGYTLVHRNGKWLVEEDLMQWIS